MHLWSVPFFTVGPSAKMVRFTYSKDKMFLDDPSTPRSSLEFERLKVKEAKMPKSFFWP